MKTTYLILAGLVLCAGCSTQSTGEEDTVVNEQVDSLQAVIDDHRYAVVLLDQIGVYMDSIDLNRKSIALDLETGLQEQNYIERMKSINLYTQKAEWTIGELEKTRRGYVAQVNRLKKQIELKDQEIKALQFTVAEYQSKNTDLENKLVFTQEELTYNQVELAATNDELNQADAEIKGLLSQLTLTEGESLYAKGEGMELMASRIEFAPKRKKEALETALQYYEQASELDYGPAKDKVKSLKEKLNIEQL